MEQKNLILVGGGGHCKSVIDVAESAGYNILGILDMPEDVGKKVLDYKVIGTDDDIPLYVDKAEFVITVGFIKNPTTRIKLYNKVKEAGGKEREEIYCPYCNAYNGYRMTSGFVYTFKIDE